MTDTKTTLFAKLASILGTIKHVPKAGWNDFHKYNYIKEDDLVAAIRPLLAEQGVSILFECEDILHVEQVTTSKGKTERIVAVRCAITIGDSDGNDAQGEHDRGGSGRWRQGGLQGDDRSL